ncbi:hypothetical protein Poly51_43890 [Rubripirellula tenax]|uniref:AAA+ ATPase domain-containing protein n=1 Tax=Rubripirellula tenax TaxID=2528015 RepID=A0A5C6ELM2_9BACT|nr:ATP-binding protein [Rubripirellula tenax]TWU48491.1 hypothetical protein Poly51_43890 [Rubripirellula tenax]
MFRSNPFCTRFVRPGALAYRFDCGSKDGVKSDVRADNTDEDAFDSIVRYLKSSRVGLIVGPHGSGKSTLLASLDDRCVVDFPKVIRVQLCAGEHPRRFADRWANWQQRRADARTVFVAQSRLMKRGLLVIDGAEMLSRWSWSQLLNQSRRRDQTVLATSHCPLPGCVVLYRTGNSPELIRSLTGDLVAGASKEVADLVIGKLDAYPLTKMTNVRDLWFELYDDVQPLLK